MKLTTRECIGIVKGIDEIGLHKMDIKTAYKLLRIQDSLKLTNDSYARIEHSLVEECMDKEASEGLSGGSFKLLPDKAEYYRDKIADALNETIEINLETLALDELEGIEMTLDTLKLLKPIIE